MRSLGNANSQRAICERAPQLSWGFSPDLSDQSARQFRSSLSLKLVAADDFDDILCFLLQLNSVRLLSLRVDRHGGENRNYQHQVHNDLLQGLA